MSIFADSLLTESKSAVAMEEDRSSDDRWPNLVYSNTTTGASPGVSLGSDSTPVSRITRKKTQASPYSHILIKAQANLDSYCFRAILRLGLPATKTSRGQVLTRGRGHRPQKRKTAGQSIPMSTHESNFCCSEPGCPKSSNTKLWYCGCCQNLGKTVEGKVRKDNVVVHLRTMHQTGDSIGDTSGVECPEEGCSSLPTASSCFDEHLRRTHPGRSRKAPSQRSQGE